MRQGCLAMALLGLMATGAIAEERFPQLTPEQMTPEQRRVAEAIMSGPRGRLSGPFNAWLRSPEVGDRLQRVGEELRFRSSIPAALNEFAILITAREWSSQYEWYAHHPLALKAGLPDGVATDLAQGRRPEGMSEDQRIVYEFCTELHRNRVVSDASFAAAKARFGERGVVDLIAVSGYYVAVSMTLNTAQVGLPAGVAPPLPDLRK
ncbi:carboxymuconolactone decarboxylase family protein [Paracraurococcus ruber]|nr:carboxymuconolactone decarboxylase family protein [Paracraurococcus ruber]